MEKGQLRSSGVFFFVFVLVGESSSMYFFQIGLHDISRSLAWKRDKAGMATHHGFFIDFSGSSKNWGKGSIFRHLSWQYIALIFQVYVASQGATRINMQRHTLPTIFGPETRKIHWSHVQIWLTCFLKLKPDQESIQLFHQRTYQYQSIWLNQWHLLRRIYPSVNQ